MGLSSIYIVGNQIMQKRIEGFKKLKDFKCRIMVTTDLTARGIDAENVNLVINLDVPLDGATYLHRIGRAGRYGSHGVVITVVSSNELENFRELMTSVGGEGFSVLKLPSDYPKDIWTEAESNFEKIFALARQDTKETECIDENVLETQNGAPINVQKLDVEDCGGEIQPEEIKSQDTASKRKKSSIKLDSLFDKDENPVRTENNTRKNQPQQNSHKFAIKNRTGKASVFEEMNKDVIFEVNLDDFSDDEDCASALEAVARYAEAGPRKKDSFTSLRTGNETQGSKTLEKWEKLKKHETENGIKVLEDSLRRLSDAANGEKLLRVLKDLKSSILEPNVRENSEFLCIKEVTKWKERISSEIDWLKRAASVPDYRVTETWRRLVFGEHYSAMMIFLETQKTAILCIYPEIRNEDDDFPPVRIEVFREVDEFGRRNRIFRDNLESYLPYPVDVDKPLPTLVFTEAQIKSYRAAVKHLRSDRQLCDIYKKLKTSTAFMNDEEKYDLEFRRLIRGGMSYSKLVSFVRDQRTERGKRFVEIGAEKAKEFVTERKEFSRYSTRMLKSYFRDPSPPPGAENDPNESGCSDSSDEYEDEEPAKDLNSELMKNLFYVVSREYLECLRALRLLETDTFATNEEDFSRLIDYYAGIEAARISGEDSSRISESVKTPKSWLPAELIGLSDEEQRHFQEIVGYLKHIDPMKLCGLRFDRILSLVSDPSLSERADVVLTKAANNSEIITYDDLIYAFDTTKVETEVELSRKIDRTEFLKFVRNERGMSEDVEKSDSVSPTSEYSESSDSSSAITSAESEILVENTDASTKPKFVPIQTNNYAYRDDVAELTRTALHRSFNFDDIETEDDNEPEEIDVTENLDEWFAELRSRTNRIHMEEYQRGMMKYYANY